MYVAPKSPKKWHKTRFCYFFPANFNICRKKSATKFLGVKTSSSKVVATSFLYFLYLTVHRWIAGDVPIHRKFVLKVTHRFRKSRFRQISLNCATSVRASKNSSIIANKWSTTSFRPSHTSVTPKSPKKWLKTRNFLHLVLPFISSLQVIADFLNLICGLNVGYLSQQMTNCP